MNMAQANINGWMVGRQNGQLTELRLVKQLRSSLFTQISRKTKTFSSELNLLNYS